MRSILVLAAAAALSTGALAQSDKDHAAHHPPGASAPASAAPKAPTRGQMDKQMNAMGDMHEKMMAAKTPEERQALMAGHMKTMQDGMAMMDQMKGGMGGNAGRGMGGGTATSPEMMGKRMDMMETLMQMMMDREGMKPPATK
ncbi:MAG: hypothetical protein ABIP59_22995 [Roseateles sp.]